MPGEPNSRSFLTRRALSTWGRARSNFLSLSATTTLLMAMLTVAACGQGKVSLQNDLGSDIQLTSSPGFLFTADLALAGQPIPTTGPLPSGIVLVAGLYAGTSSTSLALVSSETLNPVGGTGLPPGIFPTRHIILPFPGGTLAYMQVKVWDATYVSYEAQFAAGDLDYSAIDNIFTMTPGTSITFPSIISGGGSTWAAVGNETPIIVSGQWLDPPRNLTILVQPTNQVVVQGSTATFSVAARSYYPLYYQWLFNGSVISGASSSFYQIPSAQPTNSGVYAVWVNNGYSYATSSNATLTVLSGPSITMQPQSQTNVVSAAVDFLVAATGAPPLAYQWLFDGNAIPGANGTNLHLANLQLSQSGTYTVVITNTFGAVTSAPALLTVLPFPPAILGQPQSQTNLVGASADFAVNAIGAPPLICQWFFGSSPIPGASATNLHLASLQLFQSGTYTVVITNTFGAITSAPALLTVVALPPNILIAPRNQTLFTGWSLDLAVSAYGALPLSYQWLFNGSAISGASQDVLHLTNVQFSQSGSYSVVVTNAFGVVTSTPAVLTVALPPNRPAGTVVGWGDLALPYARPGTRFKTIAAGSLHSLAVASDGTVIAWGNNDGGECTGPTGLGDVVGVAGGGYGFPSHSLVLKSDGTVAAWGNSPFGASTVPPGLSGVISVSAGMQHNLALELDGTVVAWGDNTWGQTNMPAGLDHVVAVAAGGSHSLALKSDGTVVAWGDNSWGQTNIPAGLNGVTAVAAAYLHSLALKSDGTVVSWGLYGQTNVPPGLVGVTAIAAKGYHSLALESDGTVVAWGDSFDGQINVPAGLSNVIAIAAGESHNLALKSDGTIIAFGANDCGQSIVPGSLSGIIALASGGWGPNGWGHVTALKANGTIANWGSISVAPTNLSGVTSLAAGESHVLAVRSDGTVVAWGNGDIGQITVPLGLSNVLAVGAGGYHSLAVRSDGTVAAWGSTNDQSGFAGQSIVPTNLSGATAVAGGEYHSMALKSDGTVVAWGSNKDIWGNYAGQSVVPLGLTSVVAIAAGGFHSLALKSDGTVVAWGNNTFGQTDVPFGLNHVIGIAAGQYHSLALQRDGTLIAWGNNDYGQRTVRAGLPWVVGVSAAGLRSLELVAALPSLLTPPTSQTAETGSTVGFPVRAVGEPVLAYQWFFNGATTLGGATNSVLQLTNVGPLQAGAYTVVVTNIAGAVTSAPAILSVIPPVQRRIVPALVLLGQPGSSLNLDDTPALGPSPAWATFDSVALTNSPQWYFDLSAPLPPRRFYRAWESNSLNQPSTLNLYMVPALTLVGTIGSSIRIDYINQFGPIDAWLTLTTVTLTNTTQLHFDTSAPYQPPRLWRIVPVP